MGKFITFSFVFLFYFQVFSYEHMIRHGYFSCVTCHNSTSGGGDLSEYGKVISSSFSNFPLQAETEKPEWLKKWSVSLQARYAKVKREFATRKFFMQTDLLSTFHFSENSHFSSTLAKLPKRQDTGPDPTVLKKALYVYKPSDSTYVELGKTTPPFGIYTEDHTSFIRSQNKRGVFDYATQAAFTFYRDSGRESIYLLKLANKLSEEKESAISLKKEFYFKGANTLWGFDALNGSTDTDKRQLLGTYLKGFFKDFVLLGEYTYSKTSDKDSDAETKKSTDFLKLSYFPKDFLEFYTTQENFTRESTRRLDQRKTTLGVSWRAMDNVSLIFEVKEQGDSKTYISQIFINLW